MLLIKYLFNGDFCFAKSAVRYSVSKFVVVCVNDAPKRQNVSSFNIINVAWTIKQSELQLVFLGDDVARQGMSYYRKDAEPHVDLVLSRLLPLSLSLVSCLLFPVSCLH